nr:hypothetical protein [Tanacetum cinerariifolium]
MTNLKIRKSLAYKTYLAYATGTIPPKKARNFKKPASPSKKKTLFAIEEPAKKPIKKPTVRRQTAGVQIRDTPGLSLSKKKAPAKAKRKGLNCCLKSNHLRKLSLKRLSNEANRKQTFIKQVAQQSDDDRTESDDDKSADLNKTDDKEEDEFVHTFEDYVPTNDEADDVNDEWNSYRLGLEARSARLAAASDDHPRF